MKFGLILSHKGTNYGMMLQAFATQAYFDLIGVDTEIITVSIEPTITNSLKKIIRHLSPTALSSSLRKKKRRRIVAADPQIKESFKQRTTVGKQFVSQYLHDIVNYKSLESAEKAAKAKYDCVLIGSDQQWAPACFYSPVNTLSFVPDSTIKASYATSMGVSQIPRYTQKRLQKFISRINFVSVREETAKQIITQVSNRTDVEVVADPTFLLTVDQWLSAIPNEEITEPDYIFCYFLGDSISPIKIVNEYAKKKKLKVIAIRNIESYSKEKVDYGDATVLDGPSVSEFVNYIRNAKLVCTDSFHGTVFSIINSTDFVTFYRTKSTDKNSRNSRIDDLLTYLGLTSRIFTNKNTIEHIVEQSIGFDDVQLKIDGLRAKGRNYLERVITASKKSKTVNNNISQFSKEQCCGCGVCALKCPQGIIGMEKDEEGFNYPIIHNTKMCIKCGICIKSCPVHNRSNASTIDYNFPFYAYNTEDTICQQSSSGGVAAGLYKYFLNQGGKIFGVTYSDDFTDVMYCCALDENGVNKFLGSKYFKALPSMVFNDIYMALEKNEKVLIVGLPCEISALKNFLGKEYTNLYTVELICHGPTSPSILEKYIKEIEENRHLKVNWLNCRAKKPFWKPYYISLRFTDGTELSFPFTNSPLEKAFQALKRPSCNECAFKDGSSCADLLIGDYHGAMKETAEYNKYGVSVCFAITPKGKELISILNECGFATGDADVNRAKANKALFFSLEKLRIRKRYLTVFLKHGVIAASNDPIINSGLKKRRLIMKLKVYKKAVVSKFK